LFLPAPFSAITATEAPIARRYRTLSNARRTAERYRQLTSQICEAHAQLKLYDLRNVASPSLRRVEANHADQTAVLAALLLVSSRASRHEAKDQNQENEAHHQKCANVVHVPSLAYQRQPEQSGQFKDILIEWNEQPEQ
jgi:hypothetical protein